MAPVYLAKNAGPKEVSPPLFLIKGVKNKFPVTLCSLLVFGSTLFMETAYQSYKAFIAAFVYATSINTTVIANAKAYPNFAAGTRLPLTRPPMSFSLQKPLPSDKSEKLLTKLVSARVEKVGNIQVYTSDGVKSNVDVPPLLAIHNPHYNPSGDATHLNGRIFMNWVLGLVNTFLATHTYPAFRTPMKLAVNTPFLAEYGAVMCETTVPTSYTSGPSLAGKGINADHYSLLRHNKAEVIDEKMDIDTTAGTSTESKYVDLEYVSKPEVGVFSTMGNDIVLRAKPSPGRATNNYGVTTKIPKSPGLVFPYFHGLIKPSAGDMMNLLEPFHRLLGGTLEECQKKFSEFRQAAHSVCKTTIGMELTHILFMIKLALETQTRLFLVIESGRYKGAALIGSNFYIHDGAKWITPEDDISEDLAFLDPTARSMKELSRIFAGLKLSSKYTGPDLTNDFIEQPNKFIEVFRNLKIDDLENAEVSEIDSLLQGLNLRGEGFHGMNPQNIQKFVDEYFSTTDFVLMKPTFIPSIRVPIDTKDFALLSKFGPEAPSFWNEKGVEFPLRHGVSAGSSSAGKRKRDEDVFANMPDEIHVTPKPLKVALSDWEKARSKKAVKIDLKERARGYRTIGLVSLDSRKALWKSLVEGMETIPDDEVLVPQTKKAKTTPVAGFDEVVASFL